MVVDHNVEFLDVGGEQVLTLFSLVDEPVAEVPVDLEIFVLMVEGMESRHGTDSALWMELETCEWVAVDTLVHVDKFIRAIRLNANGKGLVKRSNFGLVKLGWINSPVVIVVSDRFGGHPVIDVLVSNGRHELGSGEVEAGNPINGQVSTLLLPS